MTILSHSVAARRIVLQAILLGAVAIVATVLIRNVAQNLDARNLGLSFSFLGQRAGFDIPFKLIAWVAGDTYARALLVCLLNTILAALLCIGVASALGLWIGILRLSDNWLVRNVALAYVELIRNTPQLLQVVFWYVVVIQTLPPARGAFTFPGGGTLSIRGLMVPVALWRPEAPLFAAIAAAALAIALVAKLLAGRIPALRWVARGALVAAIGLVLAGIDGIERPELRGFNFVGGFTIPPELVALTAGLSLYSSAFIAEIVRGSIEGIHRGQSEAAMSLGLTRMQALFLVVLPQALRIMIPQVTSQYLNLIKSTSLGAAVAYPELVSIFAGTVLNQSGRAIESMSLVMGIFLVVNLAASGLMNLYNRRVALVER